MMKTLAQIQRALDSVVREITAEEQALAKVERERVQLRERLESLRGVRRDLARAEREARKQLPRHRTAAQRAGRSNVDAARTLIKRHGRMTGVQLQEGIAQLRGVEFVNDGTVLYAMRALEDEHVVRRTGEREDRSVVYEFVGRRISRPGSRR